MSAGAESTASGRARVECENSSLLASHCHYEDRYRKDGIPPYPTPSGLNPSQTAGTPFDCVKFLICRRATLAFADKRMHHPPRACITLIFLHYLVHVAC